MLVNRLELKDFRNYGIKVFELSSGINVLVGENAVGKTNILEAIALVSVGESFRARRTEEMVRFGCEWGRVKLFVDDDTSLSVVVSNGVIGGKNTLKKRFFVDDTGKRSKDVVGKLKTVVFRPDDMDLMSGSGSVMRGFMDRLLSLVDVNYRGSLYTYEQALKRRNKILHSIKAGDTTRMALTYFDQVLVKHAEILQDERQDFWKFANQLWDKSEIFNGLEAVYTPNPITAERILQYAETEVAVGHTMIGAHKDEVTIFDNRGYKRDLANYGSRGEQRMAVLACKVAELYYVEQVSGEKAILLLDDIFSELDDVHKNEVVRVMKGRQVVMTTADKTDLENLSDSRVIELMREESI